MRWTGLPLTPGFSYKLSSCPGPVTDAAGAAVLYWAAGLGYVRDVRNRAASHPGDGAPPTLATEKGASHDV